jgi:hypothetical protein
MADIATRSSSATLIRHGPAFQGADRPLEIRSATRSDKDRFEAAMTNHVQRRSGGALGLARSQAGILVGPS